MAILTTIPFSRAVAMGASVWRVAIDNWGNRQTGVDATSIQYPPANQPINGSACEIVMGPESTVDRAVIQTVPPYFKVAANLPGPHTFGYDRDQRVSVDRPTVAVPGGPLIIFADAVNYYADTYIRDNDPAGHPFGGAEPLFESPVLELDFYLRPPPSGFTPPKRNQMFRTALAPVEAPDANEHLIAIWPVFGRKCMAVYFHATGDLRVVGRVGLITYSATGNPVSLITPIEATAGRVNVDATTGENGSVSNGQPTQYLAAYYTVVGGTSGFVETHMLATDDPCGCGQIYNSVPQNPFPGA